MSYYVYMLRCSDGSIYTGIAADIDRRMKEHFSGGSRCAKYTKVHCAEKLETVWECSGKPDALRLEYRIKQLRKAAKQKLIDGKMDISEIAEGIAQCSRVDLAEQYRRWEKT